MSILVLKFYLTKTNRNLQDLNNTCTNSSNNCDNNSFSAVNLAIDFYEGVVDTLNIPNASSALFYISIDDIQDKFDTPRARNNAINVGYSARDIFIALRHLFEDIINRGEFTSIQFRFNTCEFEQINRDYSDNIINQYQLIFTPLHRMDSKRYEWDNPNNNCRSHQKTA